MKSFSLLATGLLAGSLLGSCTSRQDDLLVGQWLQPIPGFAEGYQGFRLEKDGSASSLNMSTLQYETWALHNGSELILTGKSIGNGQTISFSDTLKLQSVTADSLILQRGNLLLRYSRKAGSGE